MREKMWKPGESGNPAGRPKKATLQGRVLDLLEEEIKGAKGEGTDRLEVIARIIVDEIITKRNTKVIALVLDRIWPKTQHIDFGKPPTFEINHSVPIEELVETLRLVPEVINGKSDPEPDNE